MAKSQDEGHGSNQATHKNPGWLKGKNVENRNAMFNSQEGG